jgi:peptidoglycan hydrolase CwlO-like protein
LQKIRLIWADFLIYCCDMGTILRRALVGAALVLVAGFGVLGSVAHTPHAAAQTASTADATRARLQAEYDQLQVEIAQWQKVLDDTKAKKNTLKGDVSALTAKINEATAQIKQKNVVITQLSDQISQKNKQISSLQNQMDQGLESMGKLIRQQNETDTYPMALVMFSSQTLSDVFNEVEARSNIQLQLQDKFNEIQNVKTVTQAQKDDLTHKQNAQVDAVHAVQVTQAQVAAAKTEKSQLLAITANQEVEYQKVLAANQAKAAAIRAALFPLRDAASIQFGDALKYAQAAQKTTGVNPALVLAILTQESNLGANVGQCYLTNDATGGGVGKNSGTAFARVMNPTRDVPPFLTIANSFGFDPHHQVVSCPIASAGGYGGAMGPAQFIASTWAGLAKRIARARGEDVANPWDPQDAITAMSVFLGDLGAGAGGYSASHTAAAKYYAGGGWATAGQTYADQVMGRVDKIQQNIDFLNNL